MAPDHPLTAEEHRDAALGHLGNAGRHPMGSAVRTDLLARAQLHATLGLLEAALFVPRIVVGPTPPTADLLSTDSGPLLALPNDEDALLGLTHPLPTPRKRPSRAKPKPAPEPSDGLPPAHGGTE